MARRAKKGSDLSLRGTILTCSAAWAVIVGGVAFMNILFPNYGVSLLSVVDSVYPGYEFGTKWSAFVALGYALVDGAAMGAIIGWVYNQTR